MTNVVSIIMRTVLGVSGQKYVNHAALSIFLGLIDNGFVVAIVEGLFYIMVRS